VINSGNTVSGLFNMSLVAITTPALISGFFNTGSNMSGFFGGPPVFNLGLANRGVVNILGNANIGNYNILGSGNVG
ncbi:hypothetical protein QIG52_27060, partial [Klebsiella pneumoniae]|nr:hypothetical protein [Klebsiella pneumoniae]